MTGMLVRQLGETLLEDNTSKRIPTVAQQGYRIIFMQKIGLRGGEGEKGGGGLWVDLYIVTKAVCFRAGCFLVL